MSAGNNASSSTDGVRNMISILCRQNKGLNICHINAQSLKNKIDEFRYIFEQSNVDVICVSETWFSASITDNIINTSDYNVVRNDRRSVGGGVAIYIKKKFSFKPVSKSTEDNKIEYVFIESMIHNRKTLIGSIYRPNCMIPYDSLITAMMDITVNFVDIIIAGDLNSNLLNDTRLTDTFKSIGIHTVNTNTPTHFSNSSNSLLDIFLVDSPTKVLLYDQLSVPCFSRHDLILMTYDSHPPPEDQEQPFFNFSKTNFNTLSHELSNINWNAIYDFQSTDDQLDFINKNLTHLLECSVPLKKTRIRKNDKCWFNENITELIRKRDMVYKRWKRFKTPQLYDDFRAVRTEVNKAIKKSKATYYENRFRSAMDSKSKWQTIREIGIGKSSCVNIDANPDDINKMFVSTPTNHEPSSHSQNINLIPQRYPIFPSFSSFEFSCVYPGDVISSCLSIKSNAAGFDNIYPQFVKIVLPSIAPYITYLFNTIITTAQYPRAWKHSKILPIPKSTGNHEYRPIAILPYLSKAFERIIHLQIGEYLQRHELLTVHQSGFRPKHSCITALVDVAENIRSGIDDGLITFLVLLDHSKAFDCVNHDTLCRKLQQNFNFSITAVRLISNYLNCRTQSVVIKKVTSKPLPVKAGVPQGSILGPLLFCLYINELPNILKHTKIHIYADDVQIYLNCPKSQISEGIMKLNTDLQAIYSWALANHLMINPKKSNFLLINNRTSAVTCEHLVKIGNQNILQVPKAKNLGVIFNQTLTWSDHVVAATGKVFGMLRTLYQTQYFTPIHIRTLLAKSYLIPVLIYGSELFTNCDSRSKHRLEVAYNSILRYVYGLKRFESCSAFRKSLYGVDIANVLNIKSLVLLHKIIYTKTPSYLYDKLQLGRTNRRILIVPMRHKLLVSEWQFFFTVTRLWNSLPSSIQLNGDANKFKQNLTKYFQSL